MENKYGLIIKKFRKDAQLSQVELAQKLGVTSACVSAWEVGRNEPNMGMVIKMAKLFGCTISDLAGHGNAENKTPNHFVSASDIPSANMDDEQRLLKIYRNLSIDNQRKIINTAIDLMMSQ